MKVRFYCPDPIVVSSLFYPREIRQIVQLLTGQIAELSEAVELLQAVAPDTVVSASGGLVAIRTSRAEVPQALIRFECAERVWAKLAS